MKKAKPKEKKKEKTSKKKSVKAAKKTVKKTAKKSAKKPSAKKAAAEKTAKKKPAKKPEKIKGKKAAPATKEISMPRKKISRKPIKKVEEKVAIPEKSLRPETGRPFKKEFIVSEKALPAGYGENKIVLMLVNPWKLFTYWEVREDSPAGTEGKLALRIYDLTDIDFNGENANIVFDIPVHERIGSGYVGVGPGRDFIVDIGVVTEGGDFILIARSNKVTTPEMKLLREEGVLPEEFYEAGPIVGYSEIFKG